MSRPVLSNFDSAHDVLHYERPALQAFFEPKNVAVIGASESPGSVGRTIMWNLISSPFGGTVFPVNPKRPSVLGIKAYPSFAAVREKVDLAAVVTPAQIVQVVGTETRGSVLSSHGMRT